MHVLKWYMLYRYHFPPDIGKFDIPEAGALATANNSGIPVGGVHTAVDELDEGDIVLVGDQFDVDDALGVYIG